MGAKGGELVSGVGGVKGVVEMRALPSSFNSRGSGEHRESSRLRDSPPCLARKAWKFIFERFINLKKSLKSRSFRGYLESRFSVEEIFFLENFLERWFFSF